MDISVHENKEENKLNQNREMELKNMTDPTRRDEEGVKDLRKTRRVRVATSTPIGREEDACQAATSTPVGQEAKMRRRRPLLSSARKVRRIGVADAEAAAPGKPPRAGDAAAAGGRWSVASLEQVVGGWRRRPSPASSRRRAEAGGGGGRRRGQGGAGVRGAAALGEGRAGAREGWQDGEAAGGEGRGECWGFGLDGQRE